MKTFIVIVPIQQPEQKIEADSFFISESGAIVFVRNGCNCASINNRCWNKVELEEHK